MTSEEFPTDFEVRASERDGVLTLGLAGELDLSHQARLTAAIVRAMDARPAQLVVDLRRLNFIDSTGVRLVLKAHTDAKVRRVPLHIVRGPDHIQHVFKLLGLADVLPFADSPTGGG